MNNDHRNESAPTWAELSAYVDGELDGDAAARVAGAVARDNRLAQEVARLASLKSAVQQAREPAPAELMRSHGRARRYRTLVASLILLLSVSALLFLTFQPEQGDQADVTALSHAEQLHDRWLAASHAPRSPEAGLLLTALQEFGVPVQIPDLSDARLRVAHVAFSAHGGSILHVGYVGTRGCRISLLALRDAEFPEALRHLPGQDAYLWGVGSVGYILLAEGMELQRVEVVARAAERATREPGPLSPDTRIALADSRAHSQPCAG